MYPSSLSNSPVWFSFPPRGAPPLRVPMVPVGGTRGRAASVSVPEGDPLGDAVDRGDLLSQGRVSVPLRAITATAVAVATATKTKTISETKARVFRSDGFDELDGGLEEGWISGLLFSCPWASDGASSKTPSGSKERSEVPSDVWGWSLNAISYPLVEWSKSLRRYALWR